MKCIPQIERLRTAIEAGDLTPGSMVGTEFAFSQEWGLSRNTVRRGIETLVHAGLVERRPGKGVFVRAPQTTTRSIQVLIPNLAWTYQVKIARGVQVAARDCGVHALLHDSQGEIDHAIEAVYRLPSSAFDGAIIVALHDRTLSEALYELKAINYPFVLVDQRLHDLDLPTVEVDNYHGGYIAAQKLLEFGHQRAVFLGPLGFQSINERLSGFRDAMLDAGIIFDRSLVVDLGGEGLIDWMNEKLSETEFAAADLLSGPDRPSALFDASGDVTPFIYRAATKLGLSIPEDLSVVSFDDSPFQYFLEPELSRLKHSWNDVGRVALEILVKQMHRTGGANGTELCEHRVMGVEWVPGASLRPSSEQQ